MTTPLTPRTPRASGITRSGLNIGDTVTLPEGQKAILRFIGKIQGKPGEYAGVELIDEYQSQGRHSGTFNGITYFTTSNPNTGLFITYSKLIGSTLRNSGPIGGNSGVIPPGSVTRNRLSMGPGSVVRSQQQPLHQQHQLHSQHPHPHPHPHAPSHLQASPSKRNSIAKRQSLVPAPSTPRRNATLNGPSTPSPFFSPPQKPLRTPLSDDRVSHLTKELEDAKHTIIEKDRVLEEQAQLLHDVEESLHEFQMLAKSQEQQDSSPYDIDTLLKTIEERDRKLNTLRTEFEKKRQEFRLTIDSLQQDMQETSEAYETEIRSLKENMGQAEVIHDRILELEYMVTSLEKGLEMSQMSEKNARQQLSNLADIENKLLEKEEELKEASESVEHYRNILKNKEVSEEGNLSSSSLEIQQLKKSLEDEQKEKQSLQDELKELKDSELKKAKQLETYEKDLTTYKSELDQFKSQLDKSLSQIDEYKSTIESQTKQINELKAYNNNSISYKEKYDLSREEISLLEDRIKQLEQEKSTDIPSLEELNHQKSISANLQEEIDRLEGIVEEKIFREMELEKELDMIKLHSTSSSRTVSGSLPTTPQLLSSSIDKPDNTDVEDNEQPPPSLPKSKPPTHDLPIYKSPTKIDPAAGRTLWCGLCEREGHESLHCPYEEEF